MGRSRCTPSGQASVDEMGMAEDVGSPAQRCAHVARGRPPGTARSAAAPEHTQYPRRFRVMVAPQPAESRGRL